MRNVGELLKRIMESIKAVEKYPAETPERIENDDMYQVWIIHHLTGIGEAANQLPTTFRDQHTEIPWKKIIGFRHQAVHDYDAIDIPTVWFIVVHDLPDLKIRVQAILDREFIG